MEAAVGTTNQLPGSCQSAGQQAKQLSGRCAAVAWPEMVSILIVVGSAVCCAFSALNGN